MTQILNTQGTPAIIKLTWEQWEEQFKPVQNNVSNREEMNGWMFETYGEDLEHILYSANIENVWTVLDTDEGLCISEGLHLVNRFAYFVTEIPHNHAASYCVQDEEDKKIN